MKHAATIFTIISLLSSSCATLNINEIKNLEKVEFDSLRLRPGRETNNLRIDIIRQIYSESVNDSTTETNDVPYFPLGFDLGNGLFYDLSGNFSFRLDYLLGFSSDNNFEIQEIYRPEKNKGFIIYTFNNDTLTVSHPPGKKQHYIYHRSGNPDSTSYMYKNRLKYALIETDTSFIYSGKKRRFYVIHKLNETQYYLNKRKRKENYQIIGNNLFLESAFLVSMTNNNETIVIKRQGKRQNKTLFTIERSKDKIFIYNMKYFGRKIEFGKNSFMLYQNKTPLTKFELK
jgi:hypothetical protein